MKKQNGFNLIELMIVLVIIGIIGSVAVPSYQANVIKSYRSEGMTKMLEMMRAQEDYFANNYTYTTTLSNLGYTLSGDGVVTDSGRYKITAEKCGTDDLDECVNLKGTALAGQAGDGTLQLNSRGVRLRGTTTSWTN